jgi:hypothetical protein
MDASCLAGDLFVETESYDKRQASAIGFLIPNSGYILRFLKAREGVCQMTQPLFHMPHEASPSRAVADV